MTGLGGYGPRPANLPLRRGAVDFTDAAGMAAIAQLIGDAELPPVVETAAEPFAGITTDGVAIQGLFELGDEGAPAGTAAREARGYLAGLTASGPGQGRAAAGGGRVAAVDQRVPDLP